LPARGLSPLGTPTPAARAVGDLFRPPGGSLPNVAVPKCPALPDWNQQRPYLTGQYLMESLEVEEPSTSRQQALESFSPAVQELVGKLPHLPAPCCDALCCDALRYAMMPGSVLCCAVLCCVLTCSVGLCCAVLCCAVLCCAVLCCASFPNRYPKPYKLQGLPGRDQHCQSQCKAGQHSCTAI